jgi:hypothetical protein
VSLGISHAYGEEPNEMHLQYDSSEKQVLLKRGFQKLGTYHIKALNSPFELRFVDKGEKYFRAIELAEYLVAEQLAKLNLNN